MPVFGKVSPIVLSFALAMLCAPVQAQTSFEQNVNVLAKGCAHKAGDAQCEARLWAFSDVNQDGALSSAEFARLFRAMALSDADAFGFGALKAAVPPVPGAPKGANPLSMLYLVLGASAGQMMIHTFDFDADGKISKAEFQGREGEPGGFGFLFGQIRETMSLVQGAAMGAMAGQAPPMARTPKPMKKPAAMAPKPASKAVAAPSSEGLEISGITPRRFMDKGRDVLEIKGTVKNLTAKPLGVPDVDVALKDASGLTLQVARAKLDAGAVKPGQAVGFTARFVDPPAAGQRLEATFASK